MIGLDTNILVRFFLQDDPLQSPKANEIMGALTAESAGWVGLTVLAELVWVLGSHNRFDRQTISKILGQISNRREIVIEQESIFHTAIHLFRKGNADFADCLIASSAKAAGCTRTVTFDRKAGRDAGMELVE